MVLQEACDEAIHVQNLLGHKLDALEREHELMVRYGLQCVSETQMLNQKELLGGGL
jgi:hypothetical protein